MGGNTVAVSKFLLSEIRKESCLEQYPIAMAYVPWQKFDKIVFLYVML